MITSIIGGILTAAILFGLLFTGQDSVIAAMNKYKLLPQPEKFTELYLEDHENIPKTYSPGNDTFQFTVHNQEHEPITYEYVISATSTESARIIDRGSFNLLHDGYKTVGAQIASVDARIRTKINISLENKNQSIHFWVDNTDGTTND